MELIAKAIKGTKDSLPGEIHKLQYLERTALEVAAQFGFREIRTPVFEETGLFQRSVGDTTDVVQKEMYTFLDKGGRSITLRPEGTAGVVRSYLEHALYNDGLPQKTCYLTSCYRYEKPQAGRLREFHQFGVECFGAAEPIADAEVIALAARVFESLRIKNLKLELNSIGCPTCRAEYHKALKAYFSAHEEALCETCRGRLERNPMRILDCKSPICAGIAKNAPVVLDYLCDDCKAHFDGVKSYLEAMKLEYTVNPQIVRGLDYYTRTVFEFVSQDIGAQGTVCGGGRYDGLVEEMGGAHTPSLGFAMGLERLMLLMENQKCDFPTPEPLDLFLATMGEKAALKAVEIAADMRAEGFSVQYDLNGRGLKGQMKYANKLGARFTIVLGEDEVASGKGKLKNMESGEQSEVSLTTFVSEFYQISLSQSLSDLEDNEGFDFGSFFGLQTKENEE